MSLCFGCNHASGYYFVLSHGLSGFELWKICYIDEPDVVKFSPFHHILIRKYREIVASISDFRLTITKIYVFSRL